MRGTLIYMQLSFTILPDPHALCRLPADAAIPGGLEGAGLISITRTDDELSIVCPAARAPKGSDAGWTVLRVDTLVALDEPGVVMAAVTPVSTAGLGVFVISTHLRDYLLVRTVEIDRVCNALTQAGHRVG